MSWRWPWDSVLDGTPFECLRCRSVRFVVNGTVVGAGTRGGRPAITPSGTVLSCLDCGEPYEHSGQGLKPMKGRSPAPVKRQSEDPDEDAPDDEGLPDSDFAMPTRERQARSAALRRA